MNYGKLPPEVLAGLLSRVPAHDPRVVVGPRLGEDAAVLDMGDQYLVAKSDPITFTADRIGWYAVQVNANDVAVMGARPRWFLATVLLPSPNADLAEDIFTDMIDACEGLGITLCGGHTEITPGLNRPIVSGHMLGEVAKDRLVRKERIRPGDTILLARGVAIEGTAILAREAGRRLAGRVNDAVLEAARQLLFQPGISVVGDALAAREAATVHGMHDPTEGGLVGGLYELAAAVNSGIEVFTDAIPVLAETRAVCGALNLDPLRLIASGALLIACDPSDTGRIVDALRDRGTEVAEIGRITGQGNGFLLDGKPFAFPERDEISKGSDK